MGNLFPTDAAAIAAIQAEVDALIIDKQDISEKGMADGYASLDSSAKIPINELPDAILGALKFKGLFNGSTGIVTSADPAINGLPIPAAALANEGWFFITTVAGNYTIDGITSWNVGDWPVSLGNTWAKVDNTDSVVSVNAMTGAVVLTKSDIGLGNVDNTSDADKPISNATQTALNAKVTANAPIVGATKTKVTYDSKGLVTGGADATTADIAPSTDRNYTTDAQQTLLGNTSGVNSGNETAQSIGNIVNGATAKPTPANADLFAIFDSVAGFITRKLTWSDLKANLKTYFDTLYPSGSGTSTGTNTGDDKTSVAGLLKGLGGNIVAAVSGTDYAPATTGSAVQKANGAGGLTAAQYNVDLLPATTGAAIQKASAGGLTAAVAGTDFVAPNVAIAGATKTKITYDSKGLVTGGADATTTDIAEGTNLYFLVSRAVAAITNITVGTLLNGATAKATPVDADLIGVGDSTASFEQKKTTWAQIKATLLAYFDPLFASAVTSFNFSTTNNYSLTTAVYASVNALVRLTPGAGTYIVIASGVMRTGNQQQDAYLGLFAGADGATTLVTGGESFCEPKRDVPLSVSVDLQIPVTVFGLVTLTAGQIIELKMKVASGSVSCQNATITAFKVK